MTNEEFKPDKTPWMASSNIEMASKGVTEANSFLIVELSLKNWIQILWPNPSAKTKHNPRRRESFSVTLIACLARSGLPAPNSLDTLVLLKLNFNFSTHVLECWFRRYATMQAKENVFNQLTLQLHWDHKWSCRQWILCLYCRFFWRLTIVNYMKLFFFILINNIKIYESVFEHIKLLEFRTLPYCNQRSGYLWVGH